MFRTKSSKAQLFPPTPESTSFRTRCFTLMTRVPDGQESGPLEGLDPQFRCSDGAAAAGGLAARMINETTTVATKPIDRARFIFLAPPLSSGRCRFDFREFNKY